VRKIHVTDMRIVLTLILVFAMASPADAQRRRAIAPPPPEVVVRTDFREPPLGGPDGMGWEAGFCDYSPVHEHLIERDSGIRGRSGFLLSSHNRSDDVFMFISRRLTVEDGIRPNQRYEASFRIELASQVGTGCGGIGGSPGESVYLKAGAWHARPEVVLVQDDMFGHYRLTIDKGNQSQSGPAASVAGNIANESSACFEDAPFLPILRTHRHTYIVQSNALGEIWLLVGTDSAFEGKTTLYYHVIAATLTPAP
jgi:hypothetical protein